VYEIPAFRFATAGMTKNNFLDRPDIKNSNMAPEYFSGIISELIQKLFTAKQDFYIRFE